MTLRLRTPALQHYLVHLTLSYTPLIIKLTDYTYFSGRIHDSAAGREVLRESLASLLNKVSEMFPVLLQQESLRDGPMCYIAVKVCLQMFQLLSSRVALLVWDPDHRDPAVQSILQALMDIILGQCCSRDARLLAGTAVSMLVSTAPDTGAGGAAAWSLLQVSHAEPWLLSVGALRVQCDPTEKDGVEQLAVSRGLLTCCPPHILLSSQQHNNQACLLLTGLFPLLCALCEKKQNVHCLAFEVLTLWMKKVKECLPDFWRMKSVGLMADNGSLQQQLLHIIWTNAESPVEGVSEHVRSAFLLLLDVHEMDCNQFGDTQDGFHENLLQRIMMLSWESKAKYRLLFVLVPHLGAHRVLDQYTETPTHLLHCFSTNHLSPCAAELYKCFIQQQRRELCEGPHTSYSELDLTNEWARYWKSVLHKALTSNVALLQNNSSTYLLPITFQVFPTAMDLLLTSLDPCVPGSLHAWACILSSYRAVTGCSLFAPQVDTIRRTFQLALMSADDKVRLAALNLLCCSPKTKEPPTTEEIETMRSFIPQNMNCESSPFRQHFQAGVKKFLVRIRDGCLTHIREWKTKRREDEVLSEKGQETFVEWLSQLSFSSLTPGHNYQRKKTALLLLSAVLETCTDTWSPDRKKGQPPANISSLINFAKQRGQWDFFCRGKQLVLITMLEDSTNEIRDLSAGLLVRFFPTIPEDVSNVLHARSKKLLCSPRVQDAQMGAIMTKDKTKAFGVIGALVKELEEHYLMAKADMMLAARTKPIHGVLSALQRCLPVTSYSAHSPLDQSLLSEMLLLLENISQLLLGVLYGDRDTSAPPSFCEMGNAISSLINEESADGDECVLLSEEHSLVLTCCWVSLKEIGIFLGFVVEKILIGSKQSTKCLLTKEDLLRASEVFKNILLRCRHWGSIEGCCIGFTKFCASLLSCSDPEIRNIPAQMLKQGLQVIQCPPSTSVTRRAAGLPMLILCVVSAEEASKARPLFAHSIQTLLKTARMPLNENWDQTLDLPQVCAVHTLQTLVRGSALGVAILQFAPDVSVLSLTLLSSPCWAMRNAALQLYSSLCSRMLGQRSSGEEGGSAQHAMSPAAFFFHYAALHSFLLAELREAAEDLGGSSTEAMSHLGRPSLYPILTLLAQLQPGVEDSTGTLSDFLPSLLQLAASPVFSVRVMASKALVAIAPPSQYMSILLQLCAQLPVQEERCFHNRLHGLLLQIRAVLERAVSSNRSAVEDLSEVLSRVQASLWLASEAQRCPLVRAAYLQVVVCLRSVCCQTFLLKLSETLMLDLLKPNISFQIGLSSFHQQAIGFLCADSQWAYKMWNSFSAAHPDLRLSMVSWVLDGKSELKKNDLREVIQRALESNLREALLCYSVADRTTYLSALIEVMTGADSASSHCLFRVSSLDEADLVLDMLFQDLEVQRGGPEFLSQSLIVASLLLSQRPDSRYYQRLCSVMEQQRVSDSPEVLRMACAEALCLLSKVTLGVTSSALPPDGDSLCFRMIDTGLFLLQDQSQEVRTKAACFTSLIHHRRRGESQDRVYLMHVNQALPTLMGLLLEECWDPKGSLEVLLRYLPPSDLRALLKEASAVRCSSLYEQDEANVFAEPSAMATLVLPHLLQMVEKYSQSSDLTQSLNTWAELSVSGLMDGISTFTPTWLTLLTDPRFHSTVCSLITKTAFLLRLMSTWDESKHLCDRVSTHTALQEVCVLLSERGVHCPSALTAAVSAELPQ
uniref:Thyroid adenoma-associated protein homolog n=1 Tax=Gouania willdenowi TaxID=441366 RepID=A0A8C5G1Z7_GOUWI